MARLSKSDTQQKKAQGKDMYLRGVDLDTVATYLGLKSSTVFRWAQVENWEDTRKLYQLTPTEIKRAVLDSWDSVLKGDKPKVSADMAVKYARAFELCSDPRRLLSYCYEVAKILRAQLLKKVETAPKNKKESVLNFVKQVNEELDIMEDKLYKEVMKNGIE
ncbi:MAG: hypothetical protein PHD21_06785 [Flavobacteriales bacterium]|nr:hypothetical protein [Flavobacteriales bacterium]